MIRSDSVYYPDFAEKLRVLNRQFDPAENLTAVVSSGRGYHAGMQGRVHSIRDSMDYVLLLLETGEVSDREKAFQVIACVLALQDKDPASRSYGVWPYSMEEPLDKMLSVDYNWADFIGRILDKVMLDYGKFIPEPLDDTIRAALRRACTCIIRRNVKPDYTNIHLMGALVTILSGQILRDDDIAAYGSRRLEQALQYTRWNGNISEYNSPTYMQLDAELIGEMLFYFHRPELRAMAEALADYVWRCIVVHYHAPSGQWAGPHCRCYNPLADDSCRRWLEAATDFRIRLPGPRGGKVPYVMGRYPIRCPEKFVTLLAAPALPRWLSETVCWENQFPLPEDAHRKFSDKQTPWLESRTYLAKRYVLGSFPRCDLWAQRTSLIAYWGTPERPAYMRLRCLHDGYDYSSAVLFASQNRNRAAGGVNFVTDHGDFHFILDPIPSEGIRARELKLCFELGGAAGAADVRRDHGHRFRIHSGDVAVSLNIPYCRFNGEDAPLKIDTSDGVTCIEAMLYHGEERIIDFHALRETAVGFFISLSEKEESPAEPEPVQCFCENGRLEIAAGSGDNLCLVQMPVQPLQYLDDLKRSVVR